MFSALLSILIVIFLGIADGVAEFVDNSIQACGEDESIPPKIKISFYLSSTKAKSSYIVVYDNGCGMDQEELSEFAVHALSQEARESRGGTKRSAQNSVKISKFGVGAKQAGFFLGNKIRVVTKKMSTSVREFSIDLGVMDKEFLENGISRNLYRGQILEREPKRFVPGDENEYQKMVDECVEHERSNEQFTYIIVRLHEIRRKELLPAVAVTQFSTDIACIYHFFMFPNHLPQVLCAKFANAATTTK